MRVNFRTKTFQKIIKSVSIFLVVYMTCSSVSTGIVSAGMIGTETLIERDRGQFARNYVKGIIAKEEVKDTLIDQGINPIEAAARVDSLSDVEIIRLAERLDRLPAGGNGFGALIGAALIVFIVLLITDILGYTNIFPFIT